ncbi:MAG TPA: hypothetical protein DCG25_09635, partial [Acidimicrobiaceae bacterium]|nr:hypothetical protein [Acidimicrobiaceae bacterium]
EVRFTDRLFKFHAKYANEYRGESTPSFDATLLYNMVTGDVGDPAILPLNAVKWHTEPRDIAVLVGSQSTSQFVAQLYHFGSDERSLTATFYRLNSGQYDWQLSCEGQSTIEGQHDIQSAFSLTLPSQKHCTLTLSAVQ